MKNIDIEKKKIARWRILKILNTARPDSIGDDLIFDTLTDCDLHITKAGMVKEIDFLRTAGLVNLKRCGQDEAWLTHITAEGVNVVEYSVSCPAGINRPKQV